MLNIVYTISPRLVSELKVIAELRQSILLIPLSPKTELELQFSSAIDRIENALLLANLTCSKKEIVSILTNYVAYSTHANRKYRNLSETERLIYGYKNANDYLRLHWLVSAQHIDLKTITEIHNTLSAGKLKIHERRVTEVLDYLQTAAENPVIRAAIAKLAFMALAPFSDGNELSSTFFSYLFLYKTGLDFRGMLNLEKGWQSDTNEFHRQYGKAITTPNVTSWLEYFAKSMAQGLKTTYSSIVSASKDQDLFISQKEIIGEINERQKAILTLFDEPNAVVTNRTVQKVYKVSQITASRDLAKLASLGALFVHGKGRSVRYTKI